MNISVTNMQLLVPVNLREGFGPSQVTLLLDSPVFTSMVAMAAFNVIDYFHPDSEHRKSLARNTDHFYLLDNIARYTCRLAYGAEASAKYLPGQMYAGGNINNGLFKQFQLVLEYAAWRNSTTACMVGEEHHVRQLVYVAICAFQHYKVWDLEESIGASVTRYGSATGWFNTSYKGIVDDWPAKFGCIPVEFDVPEIPCLRPDWLTRQRDHADAKLIRALGEMGVGGKFVNLRCMGDERYFVRSINEGSRTLNLVRLKDGEVYDPEFHVAYEYSYDDVWKAGDTTFPNIEGITKRSERAEDEGEGSNEDFKVDA